MQHLRSWCNTSRPRFSLTRSRFLPLLRTSSTNRTLQLLLHSARNKYRNMAHYKTNDMSNFSNNQNSFNVSNNYIIIDDRSQLLSWLSPLEPSLRHRDVRERRINDIGEWLIGSEEFRRWHGLSGEGEGDSAVLFCYGHPGVGKTFIR